MANSPINLYGDLSVPAADGHGVDVASQRSDDLDRMAVEHLIAQSDPRALRVLDVGCGRGGQAARMAKAGASVVALDAGDYGAAVAESMRQAGVCHARWSFVRLAVETCPGLGIFDVIMSQRMLHYLEPATAIEVLRWFHRSSKPGGRLFLSASGIDSELSQGYGVRHAPVDRRFAPLASLMAEKHAIHHPVCLYRLDELTDRVRAAGWEVEHAFLSPFGNVKLVASRTRCGV